MSVNEDIVVLNEEEGSGPGIASVGNGAIGSTTVKAAKKVEAVTKQTKKDVDLVAVLSDRNIHWVENGGTLKKGYNIVEKAKAENWLTLRGVRLATPEEVASAFEAGR